MQGNERVDDDQISNFAIMGIQKLDSNMPSQGKIEHTQYYDDNAHTMAYPIRLSPYAKVFYDEWLLDPNNNRYNILCVDHLLSGKLDVDRLRAAIERYVKDHLLFNSCIKSIEGDPHWVKLTHIKTLEYSPTPVSQTDLLSYVNYSFNLYNDALYRFKLIHVAKNTYRFIIVLHHLIMDGISLNEGLFEKISFYYNNESYAEHLSLLQQAKLLDNLQRVLYLRLEQNKVECKQFWHRCLSDLESLDLRFLKLNENQYEPVTEISPNPIKEIKFNFDIETAKKLKKLKYIYQVTPYAYGQCIFSIVLHRYSGQDKLAICYPITIREGQDFVYGGQVNLNLIPYEFNPLTKVTDLFDQNKYFIEQTVKNETRYGYYPITNIMQENPNKLLLDVYFAQAYFRDTHFQFEGITDIKPLSELHVDSVTGNILLFETEPVSHTVNYQVKYDSRNISDKILLDFIACYKKLFLEILEDLIQKQHKLLSQYSLLNQAEWTNILCKYNKSSTEILDNRTIHDVFEKRVLEAPDNIALVYQEQQLSYRLLNEKANQLANYLLKHYQVVPDDLVVLCLDKSDFMIIAILGVLKSSAAYVPIGDYPDERVSYVLKDTNPKAIITIKKYQHKFARNSNVVLLDDKKTQNDLAQESMNSPKIRMTCNELCYVLYTSGTTGNPKGVMQQHNNVISLFVGTEDLYHFNDKDVWTFFHSYVFDFSVWEIFGALLYGGKLIISTDEQVKDSLLFYELCYREKVTVLNQTPSEFYNFMHAALKYKNDQYLSNLRYIIFGGEVLNFSALSRWFIMYPYDGPVLINMYGITETAVHTTYRKIQKKDAHGSYIGSPILGRKVYILDDQLCPLPIGAIGELYISGGVARGYLNQPELTAQRFLPNPFESKLEAANSVLYRTGDLVRLLPDGDLKYIGRKDTQVKIRGYRIELGEIESVLVSYPGVEHAVVLVKSHQISDQKNDNDKYLVVYYAASFEFNVSSLQEHIAKHLPEFMWPNIYMQIDQFPLTINGKIDLKALPEPRYKSSKKYEAPRNEQEKLVCQAFSSILNIEKIGANEDFFELGGNSIKAIRVALLLQQNFDVKVSEVFTLRTPRNIAKNKLVGYDLFLFKLEKIKKQLANRPPSPSPSEKARKKIQQYLSEANNVKSDCFSVKPINHVLLTGSTGYLGCNILHQLLKLTEYHVYLLIRADSKAEATDRIEKKFQFYFHESLMHPYRSRVTVINGDIEKNYFGLTCEEYENLAKHIDSIIHSAALVKHHGRESLFHSANVEATTNLLYFSSLTRLKDFHYISTCSVAYFGTSINNEGRVFIEDDFPDHSEIWNNLYNKTKYLGEDQTIKWRDQGIQSSIYRVGNLALTQDGQVQENIEENSFFNWLNFLWKIHFITEECSEIQMSQVDLTAQAIVKLFDKVGLVNKTYHVFNPRLVDLEGLFKQGSRSIMNLPIEKFIDKIIEYVGVNKDCDLVGKFLLHQGWLENDDLIDKTGIQILQNKTECILKELNFQWPNINSELLHQYFTIFLRLIKKR